MSPEQAAAFAKSWISSWNAQDLTAILSHYREDIRFFSPVAARVVENGAIEGKQVLADYWQKALQGISHLEFTLQEHTWSAEKKILAIYYIAALDDSRKLACESLWFDDDGMVHQSWACYGSAL